jgi:hypothetical protein
MNLDNRITRFSRKKSLMQKQSNSGGKGTSMSKKEKGRGNGGNKQKALLAERRQKLNSLAKQVEKMELDISNNNIDNNLSRQGALTNLTSQQIGGRGRMSSDVIQNNGYQHDAIQEYNPNAIVPYNSHIGTQPIPNSVISYNPQNNDSPIHTLTENLLNTTARGMLTPGLARNPMVQTGVSALAHAAGTGMDYVADKSLKEGRAWMENVKKDPINTIFKGAPNDNYLDQKLLEQDANIYFNRAQASTGGQRAENFKDIWKIDSRLADQVYKQAYLEHGGDRSVLTDNQQPIVNQPTPLITLDDTRIGNGDIDGDRPNERNRDAPNPPDDNELDIIADDERAADEGGAVGAGGGGGGGGSSKLPEKVAVSGGNNAGWWPTIRTKMISNLASHLFIDKRESLECPFQQMPIQALDAMKVFIGYVSSSKKGFRPIWPTWGLGDSWIESTLDRKNRELFPITIVHKGGMGVPFELGPNTAAIQTINAKGNPVGPFSSTLKTRQTDFDGPIVAHAMNYLVNQLSIISNSYVDILLRLYLYMMRQNVIGGDASSNSQSGHYTQLKTPLVFSDEDNTTRFFYPRGAGTTVAAVTNIRAFMEEVAQESVGAWSANFGSTNWHNVAIVPIARKHTLDQYTNRYWTLAHMEYPYKALKVSASLLDTTGNIIANNATASPWANNVVVKGPRNFVLYVVVDDYSTYADFVAKGVLIDVGTVVVSSTTHHPNSAGVDITGNLNLAALGYGDTSWSQLRENIIRWNQYYGNEQDYRTAMIIMSEVCFKFASPVIRESAAQIDGMRGQGGVQAYDGTGAAGVITIASGATFKQATSLSSTCFGRHVRYDEEGEVDNELVDDPWWFIGKSNQIMNVLTAGGFARPSRPMNGKPRTSAVDLIVDLLETSIHMRTVMDIFASRVNLSRKMWLYENGDTAALRMKNQWEYMVQGAIDELVGVGVLGFNMPAKECGLLRTNEVLLDDGGYKPTPYVYLPTWMWENFLDNKELAKRRRGNALRSYAYNNGSHGGVNFVKLIRDGMIVSETEVAIEGTGLSIGNLVGVADNVSEVKVMPTVGGSLWTRTFLSYIPDYLWRQVRQYMLYRIDLLPSVTDVYVGTATPKLRWKPDGTNIPISLAISGNAIGALIRNFLDDSYTTMRLNCTNTFSNGDFDTGLYTIPIEELL